MSAAALCFPPSDLRARLVTCGDVDGLTSAVIITLKEPIDEGQKAEFRGQKAEMSTSAFCFLPSDLRARHP
jgi:hypothetical protein